jgi:LysR family carnitine catabolism transcriptional activator
MIVLSIMIGSTYEMDARQLGAFLAVVEHGTVTRAATRLHVSQPALSQTIRLLERELGVVLFDRIGRRLVLTAAGHALVGPARNVVRGVDVARRSVASVRGLASGTLDVVSLPTLAVEPASTLVGRFRQHHPGVTVRLADAEGTDDALGRVRDGRAELALSDAEAAAGLIVTVLGRQEYRVVFPPGTGPVGDRISPSGLAGLPMVTTPRGTSTRGILERAHELAGVEPVIAVETWAREAIVPLVVAGAGVTLLPAPLAEQAGRAGADVRRLEPSLARTITLCWRDAPRSPAAEAFVRLVG